jgi:hypothetical protein
MRIIGFQNVAEALDRLDSLEAVDLPASRLPSTVLSAVARIVGEGGCSTETPDRAVHSLQKTITVEDAHA